jgi:uncharacterized protein YigE (DUF2233 family)
MTHRSSLYSNLKILKTASFLSALRICDECRHVSSRLCAVGLYIENRKQLTALNEQQGFGNFYAAHGVVAWNDQQAVIETTQDFKTVALKPIMPPIWANVDH